MRYVIEIRQAEPGFFAKVVEILPSGRDGQVIYATGYYRDPDTAEYAARRWLADSERSR